MAGVLVMACVLVIACVRVKCSSCPKHPLVRFLTHIHVHTRLDDSILSDCKCDIYATICAKEYGSGEASACAYRALITTSVDENDNSRAFTAGANTYTFIIPDYPSAPSLMLIVSRVSSCCVLRVWLCVAPRLRQQACV